MTTIERSSPQIPPQFSCPHCHSPLIPDSKTWQCDGSQHQKNTQHPFDVARQGYVNLLPVQNKKTKDPGDSQASIDARHRFLSQGFYQPLRQLIASLATKVINECSDKNTTNSANSATKIWLDIGCGEGYYTQALAEALSRYSDYPKPANQPQPAVQAHPQLIAVDISKPAVTLMAKTAKQHHQLWYQGESEPQYKSEPQHHTAIYPIVASASNLPIASHSIAAISSIFSPILPAEFARVLKTQGRLIIAKPDTGHLQSMREALFEEVRPHHSDKFLDELAPHFQLITSHQVQADLSLDNTALADLLTMTPYSYRAKAENREALLARTQKQAFYTQARFVVYELLKV